MTNQIRKSSRKVLGLPGSAGVRVDSQQRTLITKKTDRATEQVINSMVATPIEKTALFTVALPDDDGKVFELNALAGFVVTLPAVAAANAGMEVSFVTKVLVTSNVYAISPAAADSIKHGVDDKDLENTAATDALGDFVTLRSDGVVGWLVVAQVGVWGKQS